MKAFWRLYAGLILAWTAFISVTTFGPAIEARLVPVRVDQVLTRIVRDGHRLCWTWTSRKVVDVVSDDVDVYVFVGGVRSNASVFREADGTPWSRPAATALGVTAQRWCTTLPPSAGLDVPVRVEWRAFYPSVLGLYRVALHLPDVVDPAR